MRSNPLITFVVVFSLLCLNSYSARAEKLSPEELAEVKQNAEVFFESDPGQFLLFKYDQSKPEHVRNEFFMRVRSNPDQFAFCGPFNIFQGSIAARYTVDNGLTLKEQLYLSYLRFIRDYRYEHLRANVRFLVTPNDRFGE